MMEKLRYSSFLFVLSFNMVGYNTAESNKELGPPQEVANENDSIGIDTYQIEVPAFDAEEISRNPTVDRVEAVTLVRKYLGLQDNDQLHVDVDHEDEKNMLSKCMMLSCMMIFPRLQHTVGIMLTSNLVK